MALNTFKYNFPTLLHFKGLTCMCEWERQSLKLKTHHI